MTEDTKQTPSTGNGGAPEGVDVDSGGLRAGGIVAATTDHALLVAQFADPDAALESYQALVDAETSGHLTVDGVLVVRSDTTGQIVIQKITDHSTKTGVKWGVVGGVVLGVIFPPSIIGSAAVLGVTGGVLGKLRHEHHKTEIEGTLSGSLAPNTSGILVLSKMRAVPAVRETMPRATKVTEVSIDDRTAAAITGAAKAAAA
jgi:uncharacterized membrane protein